MRNTAHVGLKLDEEDVPKKVDMAKYSIIAGFVVWRAQSLKRFDISSGNVSARGW